MCKIIKTFVFSSKNIPHLVKYSNLLFLLYIVHTGSHDSLHVLFLFEVKITWCCVLCIDLWQTTKSKTFSLPIHLQFLLCFCLIVNEWSGDRSFLPRRPALDRERNVAVIGPWHPQIASSGRCSHRIDQYAFPLFYVFYSTALSLSHPIPSLVCFCMCAIHLYYSFIFLSLLSPLYVTEIPMGILMLWQILSTILKKYCDINLYYPAKLTCHILDIINNNKQKKL